MLQAGRRPSTPCGSSGWSRHLSRRGCSANLSRAGPVRARCSRSAGSADSNASAAAGERLRELEARGVQELAVEPVAVRRAVLAVAAHRVPDRLEVHADLVRPPGLQANAQQRRARQRLLERRSASGPRAGCRCRSTSACASGGRGRAARRSCRCATAGGPRRAPGTRARSAAPRAPTSGGDAPPRSWRPRAARRCPCRGGARFRAARALRRRPRDARGPPKACRRGGVRRDGRRRPRASRRRAGRRPHRRSRCRRCSATESGGATSTGSTTIVSPPRRRSFLRAATPSSVTAPASIRRCACAREPTLRGEELIEALAGGLRRDVQQLHHDPPPTPAPAHRS